MNPVFRTVVFELIFTTPLGFVSEFGSEQREWMIRDRVVIWREGIGLFLSPENKVEEVLTSYLSVSSW